MKAKSDEKYVRNKMKDKKMKNTRRFFFFFEQRSEQNWKIHKGEKQKIEKKEGDVFFQNKR